MKLLQTSWEPVPAVYEHLGGRALIAKLLLEEIPPTCDALGPHNKLIFTPGLLGGAGVTTAGRLSVGGKSPLTGGVKEANAGGTGGDTLGNWVSKPLWLKASPNRVSYICCMSIMMAAELLPADQLRGLGTYATSEKLQEQFGSGLYGHLNRAGRRIPDARRRYRLHRRT